MSRSPWSAPADKGATGNVYEIRTVADFLKVPEDRRYICLREFHAFLSMADGIPALIQAASEGLGPPLPPDSIRLLTDVFRWDDDGKATVTVRIKAEKPHAS